MENIAKQAVSPGAAGNAISSTLAKPTQSQELAQIIVGCLMKMPTLNAPITKLMERNAEIAVMNEESLSDSNTDVGKKAEPP